MPKIEWRNWLQTEPKPRRRAETKEERQMRMQRERKMRFEIRRIAQRAMKDLALIMTRLRKVSDHPERDYARIFKNGAQYVDMVEACSKAYEKKIAADLALAKTYTSEQRDALQAALGRAGLGYWSKSRLSDKEVRIEAVAQLMKKQAEDGVQYYMEVMRDRLAHEHEPAEILVERSAMLLAMWNQMRALEKKEQMERLQGPRKSHEKGG